MKKALTNKTLEALKPTGKRYAVHDTHCPGLVVRVNANGTKTFAAIYRYGLKQRRLTLGPYPIISLAEARDKARAAFREVLEGVDPQAVRRRKNLNLREGVDAFIEQYAKPRNRAWRESERVLKRELTSRFSCAPSPPASRRAFRYASSAMNLKGRNGSRKQVSI
ncbi:MAG: hypothetical protein C0510_07720 [Erythrobacter sp.]|nr:hypothetical protein [Erythrobacter sp.]